MYRLVAAVALAACLDPSWLCAQTTERTVQRFTVGAASAAIHKGPSTASPVIGRAPRGTALEVTRELGSWVKVSWDKAEGGAGYVHVSMGSMGRPGGSADDTGYLRQSVRSVGERSASRSGGAARSVAARSGAAPAPASQARVEEPAAADLSAAPQAMYVRPPSHVVGLGGRMSGSTFGYGASARAWSRRRLGVQIEVSRFAQTSIVAPERLTSLQFAPSAIYSFRDRVTDHVWVRPYVGGGASFHRSTLSATPVAVGPPLTDSGLGYQAFGGAELTFPSVARFAISADAGYQWASTPFAGFEVGGLGFSVSGHWYIK